MGPQGHITNIIFYIKKGPGALKKDPRRRRAELLLIFYRFILGSRGRPALGPQGSLGPPARIFSYGIFIFS